ncbi:carbamoyltransferase C-terminal domain-containing protein [Catenulispora yoronensis]
MEQFHRDLAAQVQEEFEQACLHVIKDVLERTASRSLVLSGGCFLNSTLNARVLRETEIDRLFVFPAATDDGNAAGAALYAYHHLMEPGGSKEPEAGRARPGPALTHVFLGPPRLAGQDIEALAGKWGATARRHRTPADAARAAAGAIARGEIVGWFQDRAEFGPRSLGARSILCHPGLPGMKDRLNARVKFREAFRPFAGSVLAERAHKWFDIPAPDSPFMLVVCPVWEAQRTAVSEIVHVDGTCRIQTVDTGSTGPFRALLEAFEEETGLPVVLNTSFNLRGMPIVELPQDAIDCLFGSRLDRVFVGDVEIEAPDLRALRPERVGPAPVAAAAAASVSGAESGSGSGSGSGSASADGSVRDLLLAHADGERTMTELAERLGAELDTAIDLALDLRRLGRLRWAGVPGATRPLFPLPQYDPDSYGD